MVGMHPCIAEIYKTYLSLKRIFIFCNKMKRLTSYFFSYTFKISLNFWLHFHNSNFCQKIDLKKEKAILISNEDGFLDFN